ncbi:CD206 [Mytilus edulis]|uniref:MRC n=1 Tax=Mytilus edulis TaxID=6550 RepID=A0A8S3SMN3_MYTED|nr:CD206 [Mytilus edulis]
MKTLFGFSMSLCFTTAYMLQEHNKSVKNLKKIDFICQPEISNELGISVPSNVQCASLCFLHDREPCSAIIWNKLERTCRILDSTESITINAGTIMADLNIYTIWKEGCTNIGYYFDFLTNSCVKLFSNGGITWRDARNHCQQNGGDLISITTLQKWEFVESFLSCKTSIWIGLKAQQWVNGKPFINVFGFQTQLNNQDSAFPGDNEQDCTVVYFQSANVFQDESCNIRVKSNYLCEITMS